MNASANLTASGYVGNYSRLNGKSIYKVNILDLYRHSLANSPYDYNSDNSIINSYEAFVYFSTKYNSLVDDIFATANGSLYDAILARNYNDVLIRQPFSIYETRDVIRHHSYHAGMIFSRLLAEDLFDIQHLSHFDQINSQIKLTNNTKSSPDLIGTDCSGRWHIFEAKGMSIMNNFSTVYKKAKSQLNTIGSINGSSNITRTAALTYYSTQQVDAFLIDPEPIDNGAIIISESDLLLSQYKSLFNITNDDLGESNLGNNYFSLKALNNINDKFDFSISKIVLDLLKYTKSLIFNGNGMKNYPEDEKLKGIRNLLSKTCRNDKERLLKIHDDGVSSGLTGLIISVK